MSEERRSITEQGNPRKPQGSAGKEMLMGMNEHHGPVTAWGIGHFQFTGSERVLDIGCGGGAALRRMAEKVPSGHLTGVDYSKVSIALTSECNADLISQGRLNVVQGIVSALPFEDNSFDRIITVESFYFWENPESDLREVLRVLDKGGTFLIVADIHGDAELDDVSIENILKYSLFNPTLDQLRQLLEGAGFTDVQVHTQPGTTWVCAEGHKA